MPLLDPALVLLMRLQGRGMIRRMLRGATTPRRAAFFVLGAIVFLLWLGPSVYSAARLHRSDPQKVRAIAPLLLLGVCVLTVVTSAGDKAISFTAGEVDQLFPGPFTRRQLLAYKLTKSTAAAILTALVLSVALLRHASWWPACFAGIFLSLLFVQFFSINAVLAGQAASVQAYSRARRLVLAGAIVIVAMSIRHLVLTRAPAGGMEGVYQLGRSPVGRILLAPFNVFGQAITATGPAGLIRWAAIATAIDAGLLGLILLLDAHYVEAAMAASRRRSAQLERIRGGSMLSMGVNANAQWHLPQFPWAGGTGPVIWRQLTNAVRSSRGLLLLLLIVAVGAAPVLATAKSGKDANLVGNFIGVVAWLTVLLAGMLKFDFRGDLDNMDVLKSLPLRPAALAAGQLVAPVLVLTTAHLLLLLTVAAVVEPHRAWLMAAAALALPFNALLFAIENLIFLLFPSRSAAVSPGDFQVLGRQIVLLLMKVFLLVLTAGLGLAAALLVWVLTGKSIPAFTLVAALLLAAQAIALVPALGWAYARFDPSIHTPA